MKQPRPTEIAIDEVIAKARLVYLVLLLCITGSVPVAVYVSALEEVSARFDIITKLAAIALGCGTIVTIPLVRHFKMPPVRRIEVSIGTVAPGLVPRAMSEQLATKYMVIQVRSWTAATLLVIVGLAVVIVTASRGLFYPYVAAAVALLALYPPSRRELEGIARASKLEV